MQHKHIHIFLPFNQTPKLWMCVRKEYVIAWCFMFNPLYLDMQHGHWKSLILTPREGMCVCVCVRGGVCRQNICYYVVAFVT